MNPFSTLYCRLYQTAFRCAIPFLPYREPILLQNNGDLCSVLKENGVSSLLLVTDKNLFSLGLCNPLIAAVKEAGIALSVYSDVEPNPTTDNVEGAYEAYRSHHCQAILAFGGGSPIDCAKALGIKVVHPKTPLSRFQGVLKVKKKIPLLIAVPTTAGTGSETTLAAVIVDSVSRHKFAINDFPLIPRYALLDPSLLIGLPAWLTASTGLDAITHAVEAYIGRSTTKTTRAHAEKAISLAFSNLLTSFHEPQNLEARAKMLEASYYAGMAFTVSYVGYVHALSHALGGKYGVPHGLANAILLPVVLRAYGKSAQKKLRRLAVITGLAQEEEEVGLAAEAFISRLEAMNAEMGIPSFVEALQEEDIPELARTAAKEGNPLYPVPKEMNAEELSSIYRKVLK
ncbi:MAG: iron-containing alcohol dehydrogenase [Candidatus Enteromonas sp.]|nr:iron-containing alcohol dehydrogenase [Candidatus Enteromonas sp.]MDY6093760.1 iron-containing alcohol dehydrogenase [Candidatus Enteromonas sp.]